MLVPAVLGAGQQSFAVAIPALEGPLTLGIFSSDGHLVRLLHRDAPVESLPAGLNGLVLSWDGKDDAGVAVPPGTYSARGLVHGPIRLSLLPTWIGDTPPDNPSSFPWSRSFPSDDCITLRAAEDELLQRRPLLTFTLRPATDGILLLTEGLPLALLPVPSGSARERPRIAHGPRPGTALVLWDAPEGSAISTVTGLERIVPLDAGRLEIAPDASHPSPVAGESAP
jgi:hypothetical protein